MEAMSCLAGLTGATRYSLVCSPLAVAMAMYTSPVSQSITALLGRTTGLRRDRSLSRGTI